MGLTHRNEKVRSQVSRRDIRMDGWMDVLNTLRSCELWYRSCRAPTRELKHYLQYHLDRAVWRIDR